MLRNHWRAVMNVFAAAAFWLLAALLVTDGSARAQGGPPYLTNDPGTPGDGNWEINLALMPTVSRDAATYELPQLDLNYGLGDRLQLTVEVPYVLQHSAGEQTQSGWGNAYPGVKWRFWDQGEAGWQGSVFPQLETGASNVAQLRGLAAPGPRWLLPLEFAREIGPLDFDFEAGQYFPEHGAREHIFGLVAGRSLTPELELDAELYVDQATDALPHYNLLDIGGRYRLNNSFIALFMFGRTLGSDRAGSPQYVGYFGLQLLLSHYGTALMPASGLRGR